MITKITSLSIHNNEEADFLTRDCTEELLQDERKATEIALSINELIETSNLLPQIQKDLGFEGKLQFQVRYTITPISLEASTLDGLKKISIFATDLIKEHNLRVIELVKSLFPQRTASQPSPLLLEDREEDPTSPLSDQTFPPDLSPIPEETQEEIEAEQDLPALAPPPLKRSFSAPGSLGSSKDIPLPALPRAPKAIDDAALEKVIRQFKEERDRLYARRLATPSIGTAFLPDEKEPPFTPPAPLLKSVTPRPSPKRAPVEGIPFTPSPKRGTPPKRPVFSSPVIDAPFKVIEPPAGAPPTTAIQPFKAGKQVHLYEMFKKASQLPNGSLSAELMTPLQKMMREIRTKEALEKALMEKSNHELARLTEDSALERVIKALAKSRKLALQDSPARSVEVVVTHTPKPLASSRLQTIMTNTTPSNPWPWQQRAQRELYDPLKHPFTQPRIPGMGNQLQRPRFNLPNSTLLGRIARSGRSTLRHIPK